MSPSDQSVNTQQENIIIQDNNIYKSKEQLKEEFQFNESVKIFKKQSPFSLKLNNYDYKKQVTSNFENQ